MALSQVPPPLSVDRVRAGRLARAIAELPPPNERHLPPPPPGVDASAEALFWTVVTGICQQTGALRGTVNGAPLRGSDYLLATLREHLGQRPERWRPETMRAWTADDLRAAVSDDGRAESSPLDRVEERLGQLHGIAEHVVRAWGGDALGLAGKGRRVEDLLGALAEMPAYRDPVAKKSHLLLMTLHARGLLHIDDPSCIEVAVDYHVMRVALRTGLIPIDDSFLRHALMSRSPVGSAVDNSVRTAVREGCRAVLEAEPRLTPFHLDAILWQVGRNCCPRDGTPVCALGGPCDRSGSCTLRPAHGLDCNMQCPLTGACAGVEDAEVRRLAETVHVSEHY